MDILAQAPNELELLDTAARNWTQRLLQTYLAVYHQITLSQSALSNCLRRAGIRCAAKLRVHSPALSWSSASASLNFSVWPWPAS